MERILGIVGLLALLQLFAGRATAQDLDGNRLHPVEIHLVSAAVYAHPIRDIRVTATFSSPNSGSILIDAFWNGGLDYTVRFAPPSTGIWQYCTAASDTSNRGLHDICGQISAQENSDENLFVRKGWPTVSEDQRHLIYANGDPLFLLIEAAQEVAWKSTIPEIDQYAEDRRRKRFNGIWIVPMSHQYFYPYGITNTPGEPYFLNNDHSLLNPRYFDYLDQMIGKLNDSGIVAVLNPIWGRMASVYEETVHQHVISAEEALIHARYIGARYAASNVIWMVAGDTTYEEEDEKDYWNNFAAELDRASGRLHLMTAHTTGFRGSHSYFADSDWLDFHSYTPSHLVEGDYSWEGATQIRDTEPIKPGLNMEYNFEDLYDKFWLFFDDTTGAVRITSEDVRMGAYQGILSGAIAGTSYGANGIWQWGTPSTLNGFGIRRTATEALSMEGSESMRVLVSLMQEYEWHRFSRFDSLVVSYDGEFRSVAAANESLVLSYLPRNTREVYVKPNGMDADIMVDWINPALGSVERTVTADLQQGDTIYLVPPDSSDWLVLIRELDDWILADFSRSRIEELESYATPNPSSETTKIFVIAEKPGHASLEVFDVIGRRVVIKTIDSPDRRPVFYLTDLAGGVYVYRVTHSSTSGVRSATGQFVRVD